MTCIVAAGLVVLIAWPQRFVLDAQRFPIIGMLSSGPHKDDCDVVGVFGLCWWCWKRRLEMSVSVDMFGYENAIVKRKKRPRQAKLGREIIGSLVERM